VRRIQMIIKEPEIGERYHGRVVSVQPFGAFVELFPGKDGLLHISRVAKGRVEKVEDVLNIGDEVEVEILDIDDKGKVSLDRIDKPDAPPSSGGSRSGGGERHDRPSGGAPSGDRPDRPRRRH
jgi:polyribonucleotide nucleotidyltransferase